MIYLSKSSINFCVRHSDPRINNPSIALSKSIQEGIKLIVVRSFW
jgi:hypothetical protein